MSESKSKAELRILHVPAPTSQHVDGFVPQYKLKGHRRWIMFSCESTGQERWFSTLPECRQYLRCMQDEPGGGIVVLDPFDDEVQEIHFAAGPEGDEGVMTGEMHFDPGPECLEPRKGEGVDKDTSFTCRKCGVVWICASRFPPADEICDVCRVGVGADDDEKDTDKQIEELQGVIQFAMDKGCHIPATVRPLAGGGGIPVDSAVYIWQADWTEFVRLAKAAGVEVKGEDSKRHDRT